MSPFRLAKTLHFEPEAAEDLAEGAPEARRYVEHWLRQLGHFDPIVAAEYLEAPSLLGELLSKSASVEALRARIRADDLFHHWGLCRYLVDEGERAAETSAVLSLQLARLAVEVAARLDTELYHPAWVADLDARSRCSLALACHRLGRDAQARAVLETARKRARQGTRDPNLGAKISQLDLSLPPTEAGKPRRSRTAEKRDEVSSQSAA